VAVNPSSTWQFSKYPGRVGLLMKINKNQSPFFPIALKDRLSLREKCVIQALIQRLILRIVPKLEGGPGTQDTCDV
jgi:hypothetical protein